MSTERKNRAGAALRSIETVLSSVNATVVRAGLNEMRTAVREAQTISAAALWADYERRGAAYNTLLDLVRGMAGADA